MIDIHNHILYGVDDGASTIDESIAIIKNFYNNGYTDLILTPHYMEGNNYLSSKNDNKIKLEELKRIVKENDININLYLGNEVYVDDNILTNLDNGVISTLNDSRYLLIEFPLFNEVACIHDVIFRLVSHGITPIIAHPERYRYYFNDIDEFKQMIDEGALLQGNIGSLYGKYGKEARIMIEKLLKLRMISFMSSDVHNNHNVFAGDLKKRLTKYVKNKKQVEDITVNNMIKVISNVSIESE